MRHALLKQIPQAKMTDQALIVLPGQQNAAHVLDRIASQLLPNGYDDPRRDARYLLAFAMGRDDAVLPHEDIQLNNDQITCLEGLIQRRNKGEPISRMRGWREFYGLAFAINEATLDPRADSEVVVDTVRDYAEGKPDLRMVDFGTGSGCLIIAAAAHLPTATGIGVDIQQAAVTIAAQNAVHHGLDNRITFQHGSWDEGLMGVFDVIISNPPYIPAGDLDTLMNEVKDFDPLAALDGGNDGLDAWRALAPIFAKRLAKDGVAVVEIGFGQEDAVTAIMAHKGIILKEQRCDLSGVIRCLVFNKQGS